MKGKAPEKYATETKVPMTIPPETNKPTFPKLALLPTPPRTKVKGVGAAKRGITFGKNG